MQVPLWSLSRRHTTITPKSLPPLQLPDRVYVGVEKSE